MPHEHVCPWWIGYLLASPIRRIFQKPERIVGPYLKQDMRVVEIGPGMGFFTLPMARIVGPGGKIFAVDIQERMLNELRKRATKAGLIERIDLRLSSANDFAIGDLKGTIDFAFLMAVVHEVPDKSKLFSAIFAALKSGGKVLMADPKGHVKTEDFQRMLDTAREVGFTTNVGPDVSRSLSAILSRP